MSCFEELSNIEGVLIKEAKKEVYVVDSSVIFKWFYVKDENDVDIAKLIYRKALSRNFYLISPELLVYELLNIFRYKTDFSKDRIEEIVKKIFYIQIIGQLDYKTYLNSYSISQEINESIYDCIYIAMSEKYRASLITADEKLCSKAKKNNYNVMLLTEFAELY